MTDPTRQPESEANTPSVPEHGKADGFLDSAEQIARALIADTSNRGWKSYAESEDYAIKKLTEALTAFGRAQYDRGQAVGYERGVEFAAMQHAKLRRETWFMDGYKKGIETAAEVAGDCFFKGSEEREFVVTKIRALLPKEGAKGE